MLRDEALDRLELQHQSVVDHQINPMLAHRVPTVPHHDGHLLLY